MDAAWAIDVFQQRIDRGLAPCRIRLSPPVRAEPGTRLPFRLFSEIVHPGTDESDTCVFNRGVPGARNPWTTTL